LSRFDRLLLDSDEAFANGASTFLDAFPGVRDPQPRIYVKFRPEGVEPTIVFLALLDTGGHFCILNDLVANLVEDRLGERIDEVSLQTARGLVRGDLYRHRIVLIAEKGESLTVDSNVLVLKDWTAPCFIGYSGFLDRLSFAVDAPRNRFYFGTDF